MSAKFVPLLLIECGELLEEIRNNIHISRIIREE
jgi:hypothetical protein